MQSVVAKVKAADADIGSNAEMDYRIMDSDGPGMFNITTDEDTQDGVIILLKVRYLYTIRHRACLLTVIACLHSPFFTPVFYMCYFKNTLDSGYSSTLELKVINYALA